MGVERLSVEEFRAVVCAAVKGQVVRSLTIERDAAIIEFENGTVLTLTADSDLGVSLAEREKRRKDGR